MLRSNPASCGFPFCAPASRYHAVSRYVPFPSPGIVGVYPTSPTLNRLPSWNSVSKPGVVFFPCASCAPVEMYHSLVSYTVAFRPSPCPGNARTGNDENAAFIKYLLSLCQ
jgi:hypothetical protein